MEKSVEQCVVFLEAHVASIYTNTHCQCAAVVVFRIPSCQEVGYAFEYLVFVVVTNNSPTPRLVKSWLGCTFLAPLPPFPFFFIVYTCRKLVKLWRFHLVR